MSLTEALISFSSIAFAELGDKSMLAVFLLSTKIRNRLALFWGVMTAFLLTDGAAVFAGDLFARQIPPGWLQALSGLIFLGVGVFIFWDRESKEGSSPKSSRHPPFLSGFLTIFFTEWGDKTQILSALLGAKYPPWGVLLCLLSALTGVTFLSIYAGRYLSKRVESRWVQKISAALFILIGLSFLAGLR